MVVALVSDRFRTQRESCPQEDVSHEDALPKLANHKPGFDSSAQSETKFGGSGMPRQPAIRRFPVLPSPVTVGKALLKRRQSSEHGVSKSSSSLSPATKSHVFAAQYLQLSQLAGQDEGDVDELEISEVRFLLLSILLPFSLPFSANRICSSIAIAFTFHGTRPQVLNPSSAAAAAHPTGAADTEKKTLATGRALRLTESFPRALRMTKSFARAVRPAKDSGDDADARSDAGSAHSESLLSLVAYLTPKAEPRAGGSSTPQSGLNSRGRKSINIHELLPSRPMMRSGSVWDKDIIGLSDPPSLLNGLKSDPAPALLFVGGGGSGVGSGGAPIPRIDSGTECIM